MSVSGYRNFDSGHYTVNLDGADVIEYNGQSSWTEPTMLFFQTGLDPDVTHDLRITNNEDRLLAIGAVNITTVSGIRP